MAHLAPRQQAARSLTRSHISGSQKPRVRSRERLCWRTRTRRTHGQREEFSLEMWAQQRILCLLAPTLSLGFSPSLAACLPSTTIASHIHSIHSRLPESLAYITEEVGEGSRVSFSGLYGVLWGWSWVSAVRVGFEYGMAASILRLREKPCDIRSDKNPLNFGGMQWIFF